MHAFVRNKVKKLQTRIAYVEHIRNHALQMKHELHGRRQDSIFIKEYSDWGRLVDTCNNTLNELNGELDALTV
jgi:hypothetical protein